MKTLYIFSQYRVGERIFPTIPKMRKKSLLDCLFLYQMSSDYSWPGDYDVRDDFLQKYSNYFRDMTSDKTKLNYREYEFISSYPDKFLYIICLIFYKRLSFWI